MQEAFIPTQDDVLRSRVRTTGIQEAEFKFEELEFRYGVGVNVGSSCSNLLCLL